MTRKTTQELGVQRHAKPTPTLEVSQESADTLGLDLHRFVLDWLRKPGVRKPKKATIHSYVCESINFHELGTSNFLIIDGPISLLESLRSALEGCSGLKVRGGEYVPPSSGRPWFHIGGDQVWVLEEGDAWTDGNQDSPANVVPVSTSRESTEPVVSTGGRPAHHVEFMSVRDVLANNFLRVPSYQRQFAWGDEHVNALIQDVRAIDVTRNDSFRFLGYLTVCRTPLPENGFLLIDGQQRVTALSILIALVANALDSHEFHSEAKALRENCLFDDPLFSKGYKYFPQDYNDISGSTASAYRMNSIYKELVAPYRTRPKGSKSAGYGFLSFVPTVKYETPAERRLVECRSAMVSLIGEQLLTQRGALDWLERLNRVMVVLHVVGNDAEAAEVFDGINSRGKKLSDFEQLKSHMLYFYGKSARPEEVDQLFNEANGAFQEAYQHCEYYRLNHPGSEARVLDAYYAYQNPRVVEAMQKAGISGLPPDTSSGSKTVSELLPVGCVGVRTQPLVAFAGDYVKSFPTAVRYYGDIAGASPKAQGSDYYLEFKGLDEYEELILISQCLRFLRRAFVVAPLVVSYRLTHPDDAAGLLKVLRYLERLMVHFALRDRRIHFGSKRILELARNVGRLSLDAEAVIKALHSWAAPENVDAEKHLILNDELLLEKAYELVIGDSVPPAHICYLTYRWLSRRNFDIQFNSLRHAFGKDHFLFSVKPSRFGNYVPDKDGDNSRIYRDHPVNVVYDKRGVSEDEVEDFKKMAISEKLDYLRQKYSGDYGYFDRDGQDRTWLKKKVDHEFAEWLRRTWSLKRPGGLGKVSVRISEEDMAIDFEFGNDLIGRDPEDAVA